MAKPKKNFYAVKYGVNPTTKEPVENAIFKSWAEVEPLVRGVGGAEYAGFVTMDEAEEYLGSKDPLMHIKDGNLPQDALHCYVDGSYNGNIPNYGFGLVCVKDDKVIHTANGAGKNQEAISMQQIGGELMGAITALIYAKKNGYSKVAIIHDYKGVAYHATGYWKRDNKFSEDYYSWMQKFFSSNPDIEVLFCKIDAHTGEDFNELADGFAKLSVGIIPERKFYSYCDKYNIKVGNEDNAIENNETLSKDARKEKIMSEYADYLKFLHTTGNIDYPAHDEALEVGMKLLERMYQLGKE